MSTVATASTMLDDSIVAAALSPRDGTNKQSRQQTALLSLSRKNLKSLSALELVDEIVALVTRTLEADVCGLVELASGMSPPTIERITMAPAHDEAGNLKSSDSLLCAVLGTTTRLVVTDLQTDGRFRDCWMRRAGMRSAIALALPMHEHVASAVFVGKEASLGFDEDDLAFVELITHILTAHIARAKAEEAVRDEREHSAALLDASLAMTMTVDAAGIVTRANRACLDITGLRHEQIVGQPFWQSMCVPTESRLVQASFAQLNTDVSALEFESSLLTGDGERRFMSWRLCYMVDSRRNQTTVVATGVDMTRQRHAEQEAKQAIVAAEAARKLVDELRALQLKPRSATEQAAMVSEAVAAKPNGAERRTSQRKLFPYRQLIAPIVAGKMPPRNEFCAVRCWDISAGGISFLLEERPKFTAVAVILGGESGEIIMSADVMRVTEISEEAGQAYLVGCRFTGRM